MEKANTEELWTLFQDASIDDLLEIAQKTENKEKEQLFNALFNIKLAKRQQEVINQDEFVM